MTTSTKTVATTKEESLALVTSTKVEHESSLVPKAVKVTPVEEETKHLVEPAAEPVQPIVASGPTLPSIDVSKSATVERKEELQKEEASGKEIPQISKSEITAEVSTDETRLLSSEQIAVKMPNDEKQVHEQAQEPSVPQLTSTDSHKVVKMPTEMNTNVALSPKPQLESTKDLSMKVSIVCFACMTVFTIAKNTVIIFHK